MKSTLYLVQRLLLAPLLCACVFMVGAQENPKQEVPLRVSVVPYLSTRAMVAAYEPMRTYLESTMRRRVLFYSPPGFRAFVVTAQNGEYDMVISAAHIARMLETQQKFNALARFSTPGQALIVGPLTSSIDRFKQLRGKVVAIPSQLSLASIVAMTATTDAGLVEDNDFKVLESLSFSAAVVAIQKGDAEVAFSSKVALDQMTDEQRNSVKVLMDAGEFFNPVFLAHPALDDASMQKLRSALLSFGATPEGKIFLKKSGFGSIIPATESDLVILDLYSARTQKLLDKTP